MSTVARQFFDFQQGFVNSKAKGIFAKAKYLGLTLPPAPGTPTHFVDASGAVRRNPAADGRLVVVDPALNDIIRELVNAAAPKLVASLDKHLGGLAFQAAREWPTASGLSRSLLSFDYRMNGAYLLASITSGAPYTRFIAGQPFRDLIDRHGLRVTQTIAAECLDELAGTGDV